MNEKESKEFDEWLGNLILIGGSIFYCTGIVWLLWVIFKNVFN